MGFAAAWIALDGRHSTVPPPAALAADPHAGVPGAPPLGPAAASPATGSAPASIDPAAWRRLEEAQKVVATKPEDYDALVGLGNAAYDAHEYEQAIEAYGRALKLRPGDPNVMTDLGTAYRNEGRLDEAIDLFRKARALDPTHWQSLYNEVVVLALDKHDHPGADAALARLKKEHPGLPALAALERQIGAAHGGQ